MGTGKVNQLEGGRGNENKKGIKEERPGGRKKRGEEREATVQ